jgi:prefoldin subunit 5
VLDAKHEVSRRQADLDKAMKKGDPEKINKRKDKLAESRKELQEALDQLDQ